jgi:hypothetical protein
MSVDLRYPLVLFAVFMMASIAVVGFIWYAIRKTDSEKIRRGFEVKLNTGNEPVIKKERENDHG